MKPPLIAWVNPHYNRKKRSSNALEDIVLDEHVGRVFERMLRERGYVVDQAKDVFGEETVDEELIERCAKEAVVVITNNARDFEPLHHRYDHAGIFCYRDQDLPDTDPEGLARTVDLVFE